MANVVLMRISFKIHSSWRRWTKSCHSIVITALVADTDTTYLIFGGASVILLLFIIVGSIIVCRKLPIWYESKYHGGGSGGHGGRPLASAASTTTGINRIPSEQMSNAETLQKPQSLTKNALQSSTASGMSSTQPSLQRRVLFSSS